MPRCRSLFRAGKQISKIGKETKMNPDILFFSDFHLHERKEFSKLEVFGLNSQLEERLDILGK